VYGEWSLSITTSSCHYGFADKSPDYEALVFIGFVEPAHVYGAGFDAPGRGKLDNEKNSIEFRWTRKKAH